MPAPTKATSRTLRVSTLSPRQRLRRRVSAALVQHGFAVLALDLRGNGESPPAPNSLGEFEQRDILGAVDFLQTGALPDPLLDRPREIGGWGISPGAATLLLAAAAEPALRAIVSDSAFADAAALVRSRWEQQGLSSWLLPGALLAGQLLYGVNYDQARPVAVVAQIAPRPILFIHGTADSSMVRSRRDSGKVNLRSCKRADGYAYQKGEALSPQA